MRYAVISDIHGNLAALQAVLERIDGLGVGSILCLGDIVGYGPDPGECIELIRSRGIPSVMGNHDQVAAGLADPVYFNPAAREAILWTRGRLTRENAAYLADLPRRIVLDAMVLCHGTINDLNRYIISPRDVRDGFAEMEALGEATRLCYHGHTHVPILFRKDRFGVHRVLGQETAVAENGLYLANPGSVGQPRDGDPAASFLVYDKGGGTITFFRVAYDIAACQNRIIAAGLPGWLATRLALGR